MIAVAKAKAPSKGRRLPGDEDDGQVKLAKPKAGEKCYCGEPVAIAGALFCAPHGREYVADMKRRFKP